MKKSLLLLLPIAFLCACSDKPLTESQQHFAKNCLIDVEFFMRDDANFNSDYNYYRTEYGKHCDCVSSKLSYSVAAAGPINMGFDNLISELKKCGADIYKK
jgi:hypothetical protein